MQFHRCVMHHAGGDAELVHARISNCVIYDDNALLFLSVPTMGDGN
jgi:hypothetical protein